jgi:hypothetical protein
MCLVGLEAQDHEPVIIEVHGDRWAPIPALLTRDERSTQCHQASTPRYTRVSPCRGTCSSPCCSPPVLEPVNDTTRVDPCPAQLTHQPGGDFSHHSRLIPPPYNPFVDHAAASSPTRNRCNPSCDLPLQVFSRLSFQIRSSLSCRRHSALQHFLMAIAQ